MTTTQRIACDTGRTPPQEVTHCAGGTCSAALRASRPVTRAINPAELLPRPIASQLSPKLYTALIVAKTRREKFLRGGNRCGKQGLYCSNVAACPQRPGGEALPFPLSLRRRFLFPSLFFAWRSSHRDSAVRPLRFLGQRVPHLGRNGKGAQARRVIEDVAADDQLVRLGLPDEAGKALLDLVRSADE